MSTHCGAGLLPPLAAVLTRDDVEHPKPWPDAFLRADAAIGIAPATCVAVEDSHNGVRVMHAAGMMTMKVLDTVPANAEMQEKCVFVLDDQFAVRDLLAAHVSNSRGQTRTQGRGERPMRLAIISDVHGNLRALEAVLADIRIRGVDATVNLGDCVAGPTWPRESFECLATLNVPTVRGNHDRWIVDRPTERLPPAGRFAREALTQEQRNVLFALPATLELEGGILAVHGTPTDDSTYLTEESHDHRMIPAGRDLVRERLGEAISRKIVLCGHSHRQSATQFPGGPLIVNPGSVGCSVFADVPTAPRWDLRSPHARYAILTQAGEKARVEMLALEYDWAEAADKALANGFPKWAEALLTGAVG